MPGNFGRCTGPFMLLAKGFVNFYKAISWLQRCEEVQAWALANKNMRELNIISKSAWRRT